MEISIIKKLTLLNTFFLLGTASMSAQGFTISINADNGIVDEQVQSSNCQQSGEESFTNVAGQTFYTDVESYSGGKSLEMNIAAGSTGWGSFGGMIKFPNCAHVGGGNLIKGDEIWVRLRMKFPSDFEFNQNGRNKFLRLRTFHDVDDVPVSEGFNDLYLNHPPGISEVGGNGPLQYIFEGVHHWYNMGEYSDGDEFLTLGEWNTIEYYLRLDDQKGTAGGNSMVRVWVNGILLGETNGRNTLVTPESYIESLYLYTYWDNEGATVTQRLWIDDLIITSDEPSNLDANGNPFIGVDSLSDLIFTNGFEEE